MNITWQKIDPSQSKTLSLHFSKFEFNCQCTNKDCQQQIVDEDLLEKLEKVREEFGSGISITSGFRCAKHQFELSKSFETAKGISQHELGRAVDIFTTPARTVILLPILRKHFDAIGVANSFIHVDLRSDKKRFWRYA